MTNRTLATYALGFAAAVASLLGARSSWAATRTVGTAGASCPGAVYSTIQAAIDVAGPHDEIVVCAGTYAEQLTISAIKTGLTFRSRTPLAATIQAPATMADPGDIVRVHGAQGVTIASFTIAGPLPDALFCSTLPRTGIRVDGGGSATIRSNRISAIRSDDPALRGCQNGIPILVGSSDEGEAGAATITRNTIDTYEKTGIQIDGAGSSADIEDNTITGDGPSTVIAQNGIEIANGARATIQNNAVSGQIYSPTPLGDAILLFLSGAVTVAANQIEKADYGIVTIDASGPQIRNNTVLACTADGIDIDEDSTGTTNAVVVGNESRDNGEDGIYVSPASTGSLFRDDDLSSNASFDARDDSAGNGTAGTASAWKHDQCTSDNHGGRLCRR